MNVPSPPPRNLQRQCPPPGYNLATQMARLHRLGRAHSHEGVTSDVYYQTPDEDGKFHQFI